MYVCNVPSLLIEAHFNTRFGISQTYCRFKKIPKSVANIKYRIHLPITLLCPVDVAREKVEFTSVHRIEAIGTPR